MTQAFHNGIDFNTAFAGKLTMVEDQAVIVTAKDREVAKKAFQTHIQVIFTDMHTFISENDIESFMGYLGENAKNLACRLGKQGNLDKKIERTMKIELMAQEKGALDDWLQLVAASPGIPSRDPAVIAEC